MNSTNSSISPVSKGETQRPLLSFVLVAYNQERFIREAVDAALSQTYSPLEIILSDDGSKDATFTIIQEMAQAYSGPHRVICNRNEKNLGIGNHINKVLSLATGEWAVVAAGDDISFPERTEVLFQYIARNPDVRAIGSNSALIDEMGREVVNGRRHQQVDAFPMREFMKRGWYLTGGCAMAYHRQCWEPYPPINANVIGEDLVLPFRGAMFGRMALLKDDLVCYRSMPTGLASHFKRRLPPDDPTVNQLVSDVKALADRGMISQGKAAHLEKELIRYGKYRYYFIQEPVTLSSWFNAMRHLSLRKDTGFLLKQAYRAVRHLGRRGLRGLRVIGVGKR